MGRKKQFSETEDHSVASLQPSASLEAFVIFQTMGALKGSKRCAR